MKRLRLPMPAFHVPYGRRAPGYPGARKPTSFHHVLHEAPARDFVGHRKSLFSDFGC